MRSARPSTAVTVKPSPLFDVAHDRGQPARDCGADLCSGQTGTATVDRDRPAAARRWRGRSASTWSRAVRDHHHQPGDAAGPDADRRDRQNGTAAVGHPAPVNAPTQPAQIRATDVTSGQQQIANFTVVSSTVNGAVAAHGDPGRRRRSPGARHTTCSTGFRVDYYIFGGTPPYTVAVDVPDRRHARQFDGRRRAAASSRRSPTAPASTR